MWPVQRCLFRLRIGAEAGVHTGLAGRGGEKDIQTLLQAKWQAFSILE